MHYVPPSNKTIGVKLNSNEHKYYVLCLTKNGWMMYRIR